MGKARIFISFAIEDRNLRDFLVGQAKTNRSPFEFVDMSVKEPWRTSWKTRCRTKIRGCDGMIGIITTNTKTASGQLWEINCAYEESIPVLLVFGSQEGRPKTLPEPVGGRRIHGWTWTNISEFLKCL